MIVTFQEPDIKNFRNLRRQLMTYFLKHNSRKSSTEVISIIAKEDRVIFAEIKLMLTFLCTLVRRYKDAKKS